MGFIGTNEEAGRLCRVAVSFSGGEEIRKDTGRRREKKKGEGDLVHFVDMCKGGSLSDCGMPRSGAALNVERQCIPRIIDNEKKHGIQNHL